MDDIHHQLEEQLAAHHQNDVAVAAAAAAAAAAQQLGLTQPHHFAHQLQQPDFGQSHHKDDANVVDVGLSHHEIDVNALHIPSPDDDAVGLHESDTDLDLALSIDAHVDGARATFGRPPSIRKACDLCHAAKQKCSGERPSCSRCVAGGWQCNYAPRQRRRTVPKESKLSHSIDRSSVLSNHSQLGDTMIIPENNGVDPTPPHQPKKRKISQRDNSLATMANDAIDLRVAMAMDSMLHEDDEEGDLMTLSDEQMLESIAIDGYLADLPLETFVRNLPYTAAPTTNNNNVNFSAEDFQTGGDNSYSAEMDQHTTSALRDAIFSLNESSGNAGQVHDGSGVEGVEGGDVGQGLENLDGQGIDPHLALLDLSHAMPVEDGVGSGGDAGDLHLGNLGGNNFQQGPCSHVSLVPHVLALLINHPLEPKPGSNTPLNSLIFPPLARSLRLFHSLIHCQHCLGSPQQTLPQLALLSRTTTILTFPFPPSPLQSSGGTSAQLTVHGAKLTGTGISEAIEQHIVGVVWDSWRASMREIFATIERKAQDVIAQSTIPQADQQHTHSSAETQRAGLMFQAATRLITAMDEVEAM